MGVQTVSPGEFRIFFTAKYSHLGVFKLKWVAFGIKSLLSHYINIISTTQAVKNISELLFGTGVVEQKLLLRERTNPHKYSKKNPKVDSCPLIKSAYEGHRKYSS